MAIRLIGTAAIATLLVAAAASRSAGDLADITEEKIGQLVRKSAECQALMARSPWCG